MADITKRPAIAMSDGTVGGRDIEQVEAEVGRWRLARLRDGNGLAVLRALDPEGHRSLDRQRYEVRAHAREEHLRSALWSVFSAADAAYHEGREDKQGEIRRCLGVPQ